MSVKPADEVCAHEIKFSMEVSIGLVLSDLRKDARPGVRAKDVDGMWKWDE